MNEKTIIIKIKLKNTKFSFLQKMALSGVLMSALGGLGSSLLSGLASTAVNTLGQVG